MITDEYLELRRHPCEVVDGRVRLIGPGTPFHERVKGSLQRVLSEQCSDWWICASIPVRIGPDIYVPDLVGWRRSTLDPLDAVINDVAPEWVCEIFDSGSAVHDRVYKRRGYARGVSHYWLMDISGLTLETLYMDREWCWICNGAYDSTVVDARIEPFEDVALDLSLLLGGEPACGTLDST